MSSPGIFIFGLLVFAMVAAACWLIAYGIVAERRDRRQLEHEQATAPGAAGDGGRRPTEDPRLAGAG